MILKLDLKFDFVVCRIIIYVEFKVFLGFLFEN